MFEIESIIQLFDVVSPEILFAIGGFGFNLLVLPTLLNSDAAIPRTQSVLSVFVLLFFFAIPYYWIGFYWSSFANVVGVVLWSIVAVYRSPSPTTMKEREEENASSRTVQPAD